MSSTNQKNIFIDTEQYHGSDNKAHLLFPSQTLVVPQGFGMKLSLQQFNMKKCFYNINSYNNTFYIYNTATTNYTEVKIAEGNYYTFGASDSVADSLCKSIKTALASVSVNVGVTYNINTAKIELISNDLSTTNYIVFFQIPELRQTTIPTNVTANGYFSDTAEIFGGIANQEEKTVPISGLDVSGTSSKSYYPASLFSMENLNIRVDLGNSNLETPNMDANSSTSICIPSQLFATIPLQYETFNGMELIESAMINYMDSGDEMFSLKLQQSQINTATFSLVDNKGRPLEETNADQYKNGQLSYGMVIRYEIIEEPVVANPSNPPSNNRTLNLLPALK